MDEIWKPVVGYEGYYEISNLGRVKSFVRGRRLLEGLLRPVITPLGYAVVRLYKVESNASKLHYVHRLVAEAYLSLAPEEKVDHCDRNRANNRVDNLRLCSAGENGRNSSRRIDNTSGFKGVNFETRRKKYRASIEARGKRRHLGYFDDPETAARAYDRAATKFFGKFAATNVSLGLLTPL